MRRAGWLFFVVGVAAAAAIAACGHAPPKAPPRKELPVLAAADLAGSYVASDDLDWSYRLAIGADGSYVLSIDRGKLAACDERGTLKPTADHLFALTITRDTCVPERVGYSDGVSLHVNSFTGDALVVVLIGPGAPEPRGYQRAPSQTPLER